MRAIVFVHEPTDTAHRLEERLVERGFEVDSHLITDGDCVTPFPDIAGYDLVLSMGSTASLTRKHEIAGWIHDEIDIVRAAHESGTPILGVCFGGQVIADALGGSVEVAPVTELGWYEIGDGDASNPVGAGPWLEWHHDRFTPPPGAEVLARTPDAVQLFRIGRTVGTQFHPEVDAAQIATFLEGTTDEYLAEHGATREQLLDDSRRHEDGNVERCHALVDWFLDEVAFPQQPVSAGADA